MHSLAPAVVGARDATYLTSRAQATLAGGGAPIATLSACTRSLEQLKTTSNSLVSVEIRPTGITAANCAQDVPIFTGTQLIKRCIVDKPVDNISKVEAYNHSLALLLLELQQQPTAATTTTNTTTGSNTSSSAISTPSTY